MKIPRKIKIGPHTYTVRLVKELVKEHGKMGVTVTDQTTMSICEELSLTQKEDTLLHEVLHAIQDQVNFMDTKDQAIEENGIIRLTPLLLQVIKDNRKLFE